VSSSTTGDFAINLPSSYQFEVLEELPDLNAKIDSFDSIDAGVGVLFFKMGRKFLRAFLEFDDIGVLVPVEIEASGDAVFPDLRIHVHNLIL
jgi:hypothetical protein